MVMRWTWVLLLRVKISQSSTTGTESSQCRENQGMNRDLGEMLDPAFALSGCHPVWRWCCEMW